MRRSCLRWQWNGALFPKHALLTTGIEDRIHGRYDSSLGILMELGRGMKGRELGMHLVESWCSSRRRRARGCSSSGMAGDSWRATPHRPTVLHASDVTSHSRVLFRRRARVQRNAAEVVEYLENVCGVPLGIAGVAQILMKTPQILLCKVIHHDRWNIRVIELAAFTHFYGHCDVPAVVEVLHVE